MPSSYTDSLRLEEQGIGENNNTWGNKLNTTLDLIDKSIAGHVAVGVTSGTTTLTSVNNGEDQARYKIIEVTGTLSGNVVIQVPAVSKEYIVWNSATVGAYSVTFRLGAAGDTVVIPATSARAFGITTDGSEWRPVSPSEATTSAPGIVELATDAEAQAQSATDKVLTPGNLGSVTATETRKGVIELATNAEAQAGTDTSRALTPASLQAVTATETRRGVVELATNAEAQAGTDTERAVTPAGLAAVTATDTRRGLIEVATQTEVNAGTDTSRALVPARYTSNLNTRLGTTGNLGNAAQKDEGAGNGLDADLLDGVQGSGYVARTEFNPGDRTVVFSGSGQRIGLDLLSDTRPGWYSVSSNTSGAVSVYLADPTDESFPGMKIRGTGASPVIYQAEYYPGDVAPTPPGFILTRWDVDTTGSSWTSALQTITEIARFN